METVGQLARSFGLSRSTLLYYDSIGLLRPSERSRANYRLYTREDRKRLEAICRYRKAGLGLAEIRKALAGSRRGAVGVLEQRLEALDREIGALREQQRVVARLLRKRNVLGRVRTMDKGRWIEVLRATGLSDDDMRRWHVEFERRAPGAHRDFMESLGMPAQEIESVRRWARRQAGGR